MRRTFNDENKVQSVVDGLKIRPIANGWLKSRAVDRLALSEDAIDAYSVQARNVKTYTMKSTYEDITPERRWAMASTIRRSPGPFVARLGRELAAAAFLEKPAAMRVETITTEDMFTDEDEDEAFALHYDEGWEDRVNDKFTGEISVIIDMEDSPQSDVDLMVRWLKDTGAYKLFDTVDGPKASYRVHRVRSTVSEYLPFD
jgi:hypothetical protein